jgi:endonuclease YncB( thermonuclease family)
MERNLKIMLLSWLCVGCVSIDSRVERSLDEFLILEREVYPPSQDEIEAGQKNYPADCDWRALDRVVDGDTIRLREGMSVRLIGIDTPEVSGPYTQAEPFGEEASAAMKVLLEGVDRVCLIDDTIGDLFDKYDRRLAYVFDLEGKNLNRVMLQQGWAEVYRTFPFDRKVDFLAVEKEAQFEKLGRWGGKAGR